MPAVAVAGKQVVQPPGGLARHLVGNMGVPFCRLKRRMTE
jgi:hypothetical protein